MAGNEGASSDTPGSRDRSDSPPNDEESQITYIASQLTRVVTYVVQLGPRYAIPFGDNFEEILIGPSRKEEYVPR
jgi:hypothetical protein